jgi:ArsR family metal-binding transcriptional regulator
MDIIAIFPRRSEFEKAVELLRRGGSACAEVRGPEGYAPALRMDRAGLACVQEAAPGITCAGWTEYRAARNPAPWQVRMDFGEDPLGEAAIMFFGPCMAVESKVRLIAHLAGDLAPVLPYLNAEMKSACYNRATPSLTFMEGYRLVTLYGQRIAIGKADGIEDGWRLLEKIRALVDETWARRAAIAPSFEMRAKPPALEIYKRLPRTNCGACGESTCMAFAVRLWMGEDQISGCTPVFGGNYGHLKDALGEICSFLGGASRSSMTTVESGGSE